MDPSTLERAIRRRRARTVPGHRLMRQAAVAAVLRGGAGGGLELLFIRRAVDPRDPWSGHVAFPGGRREPGDADPLATAVRETREEIGLDLTAHGRVLGPLSHILATTHDRRRPMVVMPWAFHLADPPELPAAAAREVRESLWVPVARLTRPDARAHLRRRVLGVPVRFGALEVDDLTIWGLTYHMLRDLLARLADDGASVR